MRLTEKTKNGYLHKLFGDSPIYTKEQKISDLDNIIQKLGQLEDIEEELGIDLVIFLKVCIEETPVYSKDRPYPLFPYEFDNIGFMAAYEDEYDAKSFLWKDYDKTWALDKNDLTKEELL